MNAKAWAFRPASRELIQRAGWGVADQALSSLTNFALSVLVARSVTPTGYGAFSVVFATFTAALGLSRALTSEPLMVRYSGCDPAKWQRGASWATGVALTVGVVLGVVSVIIGVVVGGAQVGPFVALGLTLPGLLVQDCWRFAFFTNQEGSKAFWNDAMYAIVLFLAFAAVMTLGRPTISALVLAWGGAATVSAIVGVAQAHVAPVPHRLTGWWIQHRDLIPRYLGEFAVGNAAGQLSVFGVGAVAGLATLGSLRAGFLLFGPLQVLFMGAGMVAVPELINFLRRSPKQLWLASVTFSLVLTTIALAWGSIVIFTPASLGTAMLGTMWNAAHPLAVVVTASWMGSGVIIGASAAMRALAAASLGLVARGAGALVAVLGAIAGAAVGGAHGAAWGGAIAAWIEAAVWWRQLRRVLAPIPYVLTNPQVAVHPAPLDPRVRATE